MTTSAWWQHGIIYQVYPRSFQDSDGDGVGDLTGIRRRLDYLVQLGIDAIWISPFYPSPMADFGYDVSDYCGVDPLFGTLADFDALVVDAHARGLRIIVDFVPNHTSDRHPWFVASRSSRRDVRRDWYLWRDPGADGGPPNNWQSNFGGSAWTFDPSSGQYYYHSFLAAQPDLNWRNPAVRTAMYDAMRFWLARGVDGFRLDVIYQLIKDAEFRDNPPNPAYRDGDPTWHRVLPLYTTDRPEVHDITVEMRDVVAAYDRPGHEHLLIGELYLPLQRLVAYYGADASGQLRGVQLPFNFQLIGIAWKARDIDRVVRDYEAALPVHAWPNWVLGNHDQPRIATRVGRLQARVAAMLLLTLRGTPTLYYGDEIGMRDVAIPPDAVQDPLEKNEPGKGLGRDPQRTPMQWDESPGAGFTTGRPWLQLADDHRTTNVASQANDATSLLALVRALTALRSRYPALAQGSFESLSVDDASLVYARCAAGSRLLVALNFTDIETPMPDAVTGDAKLLLSSALDRVENEPVPPVLRPNEGIVAVCASR